MSSQEGTCPLLVEGALQVEQAGQSADDDLASILGRVESASLEFKRELVRRVPAEAAS